MKIYCFILVSTKAWGLRGVLMRESLVPPFTHSNAFGSRVASAHWEKSSARVLETFIRLTGASESEGRMWSRETLNADALSVELTLRLAGDGAAPIGAGSVSGVGLWFAAAASDAPQLVEAFAAPALVDTAVSASVLSAIGVVFAAEGAQIVSRKQCPYMHGDAGTCGTQVQTAGGVISVIGTCRAALRFDTAKQSYDVCPRVAHAPPMRVLS